MFKKIFKKQQYTSSQEFYDKINHIMNEMQKEGRNDLSITVKNSLERILSNHENVEILTSEVENISNVLFEFNKMLEKQIEFIQSKLER